MSKYQRPVEAPAQPGSIDPIATFRMLRGLPDGSGRELLAKLLDACRKEDTLDERAYAATGEPVFDPTKSSRQLTPETAALGVVGGFAAAGGTLFAVKEARMPGGTGDTVRELLVSHPFHSFAAAGIALAGLTLVGDALSKNRKDHKLTDAVNEFDDAFDAAASAVESIYGAHSDGESRTATDLESFTLELMTAVREKPRLAQRAVDFGQSSGHSFGPSNLGLA